MQMSGLYFLVRLEALEVVKNSAVKTIKALQTLARLINQVVSDIARHRSTPSLTFEWLAVSGKNVFNYF
jgi:ribosome-binding factor A